MPNAIKYNVSAETLALKKGNFWIGTGDVSKGPTSNTGYYNGITPPSGGYTIYLNKANNGPSIYTVTSDAQLISLTNTIAGASYTTVAQCLTYYAGQTDKMIFNIDYPPIVTNGLTLNLDATVVSSYPNTDNTFYDLSGGNGYRWGPQSTSAYWLVGGDSDYAEGGVGNFSSLIGRWVQMVGVFDRAGTYGNGPKIYCYINGSNVGSNTIPTANNMNNAGPIMPGNCCGAFDGYVSVIRVYNKALTQTEITQNWNAQKSYFGL